MFTPTIWHRRVFNHEAPAVHRPTRETRVVNYVPAAQVQRELDEMLNGLFTRMAAPWAGFGFPARHGADNGEALIAPRLNVASDDKAYTITAELSGVRHEDVTLEIKDNTLVLKGEKKEEKQEEGQDVHVSERVFGSFERVMGLPDDAVIDEIKATHKDGILTVSVPRREPEHPKARTVEITAE